MVRVSPSSSSAARICGVCGPERGLVRVERQLVDRARELRGEDVGIVRVDHRRLGRAAEEVVGVVHQVLVHGLVVAHQHRHRRLSLAPRAPGLLPGAGQGGRRADHDHRVEPADVHPQLEGVGAHHAAQLAREQRLLDAAPLLGQVAAAVGADALVHPGRDPAQPLARVAVDQLGRDPRLGEAQRLRAALEEAGEQRAPFAVRGAALHPAAVHERRIPEREVLLAARGRRRRPPPSPRDR
jgi:hypothetical protein